MKRSRSTALLASIAFMLLAGAAVGKTNLKNLEPPVYTTGGGPFLLEDGSLFVVNDGEWAAIPFYRDPLGAPAGFDFLHDFDEDFAESTLHVSGDIQFPVSGRVRRGRAPTRPHRHLHRLGQSHRGGGRRRSGRWVGV
jgi:hypothetical protein